MLIFKQVILKYSLLAVSCNWTHLFQHQRAEKEASQFCAFEIITISLATEPNKKRNFIFEIFLKVSRRKETLSHVLHLHKKSLRINE